MWEYPFKTVPPKFTLVKVNTVFDYTIALGADTVVVIVNGSKT